MTTPRNKFIAINEPQSNRSQSENTRQRTAEFSNTHSNFPTLIPPADNKEKTPRKNVQLDSLSNAGDKRSLHSTPRNKDFSTNNPNYQSTALVYPLNRRDSADTAFTLSREQTPEVTPRQGLKRQSTVALFSTFSKNMRNSNNPTPKRTTLLLHQQEPLSYTKQPRENYFLKTKLPQPNPEGTRTQKRLPSLNLEKGMENQANSTFVGLASGLFASARKKKPEYYSILKKDIIVKEEILIDKPVKSTISVQNLQIAEKLAMIISHGDSSERNNLLMRKLYSFLELVQNLFHIMRESVATFKLIQTSLAGTTDIAHLFNKHPCKEIILEIANWVYSSRCYEQNLKELSEVYDCDAYSAGNEDANKAFDEVQVNYLISYLSSNVQDFEKLLNISKTQIPSEISIRDRDLISRTIRQADIVCNSISELLLDDFSVKKVYLANECRNLICGLLYSIKQIRVCYTKIREMVEECLETYKNLFRQMKHLDKNAMAFVENQKKLKRGLEKLQAPIAELNTLLNGMETVDHNVKTFGAKYTDGIDTLKKVLLFKLKVENTESLFQMPTIERKLSKHMDMLSEYVIRANPPNEEQIAAMFSDLNEIPRMKRSFTLFVSYLHDLLKSPTYHELFYESYTQLKAIDENVNNLYNMVNEQFEGFLKNYFGSLIQLAAKQKRAIKNEYWKILTWNDFGHDSNLEASIARVSESVGIIKDSLAKTKLLSEHGHKKIFGKQEMLDENMKSWSEEIIFAEDFIEYLTKITSEVLKPQAKFNSDYAKTKKIKASFDKVLVSYIKLRNSRQFNELCFRIGLYIRGKQQEDKQDFLLTFEDSIQRHYMDLFFKNFFSKLQEEFQKSFVDLLTPIPSDKFEKLKCFIASCGDVVAALCQQRSIQALQELNTLLLKRQEDISMVVALMDQILLFNEKKPRSLSNEDEAKIRSGSQSPIFKFLLESVNSYEALHGQLNLTLRSNELDAQMQKIEEKVTQGDFEKADIDKRLSNLERLTKSTLDEMKKPKSSESKRRDSISGSSIMELVTVRIPKLRRKMLKTAMNKQLNEIRIIEDECKKVIHKSLEHQKDCYEIKVSKEQIEKLWNRVEDMKKNREELEDNEVAQEILDDLENNLGTLQVIALTKEKLELIITGKLENLEEVEACCASLKELKEELINIVEEVEFLDADMRNCTMHQLSDIEIIENYLSNAYKGMSSVDIEIFKNEQRFDQIRFTLGQCFEINFYTHPSFKEKIYAQDLEAIKTEIGAIRSGLENLSSLLRLDNLGMDETVISSYEQASQLHGWLEENLLRFFEDLVVITRLYGFLSVIAEDMRNNITVGTPFNSSELGEKIQQAKDLHQTIKDHESELLDTLREIDSGCLLRGKMKFIEFELELVDLLLKMSNIEHELAESKNPTKHFELIHERKSVTELKKAARAQFLELMQSYNTNYKEKDRTGVSLSENELLADLALTFELLASGLEIDLRRGEVHIMGSLEDEFYLRLYAEKLGAVSPPKESRVLMKILSEIRSVIRRKSIFDSNLGAKYLVDAEFSMIYKTSQGSLICAIIIRMDYQDIPVIVSIANGGQGNC